MDFSNPNGETIRNILDGVGFASDTRRERTRSKDVRCMLLARGLLFAMMRPTDAGERTPAHAYLHPVYAQAALQEAPHLRDYQRIDNWLKQAVPLLQTFATGHTARALIGGSIAAHYNRIADQTLKLPHSGDDPWIPAYGTVDGIDPMALMGVTARRVELSAYPQDVYVDKSDYGRTYYRMMGIAEHIGWTIPGIGTEETRTAIFEAFQNTASPQRAVDPQALFMAGKLGIGRLEVPISEVLDPRD